MLLRCMLFCCAVLPSSVSVAQRIPRSAASETFSDEALKGGVRATSEQCDSIDGAV